MQRTDANVTTPEGVCPAILITPDGDGPFAPVILFTDAGGVRAALIEIYPALHGFAVPDNLTYDAAAADRHWRALETLYAANLTS